MKTANNGRKGILAVAESKPEAATVGAEVQAAATANNKQPYVLKDDKQKPTLNDGARVVMVGSLLALVLVLFVVGRLSRRPSSSARTAAGTGVNMGKVPQQPDNSASGTGSVVPLMEMGHNPGPESEGNPVHPDQIGRTAKPQPGHTGATALGDIAPFDNHGWEPGPYQPGAATATSTGENASESTDVTGAKSEREAMDKASLVFVKSNNATSTQGGRTESGPSAFDLGIGLSPGTKLRARLDSAVSTAVATPVVAVVEYNYEHDGEIVVPAGAKVFGRLEAADRSGYVGVRFDSMLLPDGSAVSMEAAATDLALRPLKGKVEGAHAGKNILVRSLAGVGEIAATLVGRGSLNQPLSESDLLRERVSNNIGQASDEQVSRLAITERVVVSVPANTEIYVVLEKPAKTGNTARGEAAFPGPQTNAKSPSMQELRELLQLQRELNQAIPAVSSSQ
ncbi:MAG TPA: TrbI/VirB10 family protein [Candidatus Angelobacter sp.]